MKNHLDAVNRLFCEPEDPMSEFDPYDWDYWDALSKTVKRLEGMGVEDPFWAALNAETIGRLAQQFRDFNHE